jgi:hypothetical protein
MNRVLLLTLWVSAFLQGFLALKNSVSVNGEVIWQGGASNLKPIKFNNRFDKNYKPGNIGIIFNW